MNEKQWLWTAVIIGGIVLGVVWQKQDGNSGGWIPNLMKQQQSQNNAQGWPNYLQQAKTSNKQLFVYFGRMDCQPCQKMKSEVLSDASVQPALSKYIVCLMDANQDLALARKLGVQAVPAMLIVDGNEQVIKSTTGYMAKEQFIVWLGAPATPPSPSTPPGNSSPSQPPQQPPGGPGQRPPGGPGQRPGPPGIGPNGPGRPGGG